MIMYQKIRKAGCLPYHYQDGEIKLLFMKPSDPAYGGPNYQIAKGNIDFGYSSEETAKKEALEELGISIENTKGMFFLFCDTLKPRGGPGYEMFIYAAETIDPHNLLPFHYETSSIRWMGAEEIGIKTRIIQRKIIYKAMRHLSLFGGRF